MPAIQRKSKPEKPYSDYPLTPHNCGRWCKKIKRRFVYFERFEDDPDGSRSLARYLAERDDLYAGRDPQRSNGDPTLADALNQFLSSKKLAQEIGELTEASYAEYQRVCDRVAETIGKHRTLTSIDHTDLQKLRAALAKGKRGKSVTPTTLFADLTRARSLFLFANEFLLDKPIKYRKPLASPSRRTIRQARLAVGPRLFARDEIERILAASDPTMRALVYLGINVAFGPRDCSSLPVSALDLDRGWHNHPRPKTTNPRRAKLWPETIAALSEIVGNGPLVFDLKTGINDRPLSVSFQKLLVDLGIYRRHVKTFYSLRRTFATIAATCNEPIAAAYIMGHIPPANDMASIYRQKVYDTALVKVANHVRGWLNGSITID